MLLVDADVQGNLTDSLGYQYLDNLPVSLATVLNKIMMEELYEPDEDIFHHAEGVDCMPGNIELSAIEVSLVNTMSRKTVLHTYINTVEIVDSVKQYGVLVPGLVRPKADGGYEMVAGHRRKKASELAVCETMPCIVRNLDDDEATIIMVDSNLQSESILPSEKSFCI